MKNGPVDKNENEKFAREFEEAAFDSSTQHFLEDEIEDGDAFMTMASSLHHVAPLPPSQHKKDFHVRDTPFAYLPRHWSRVTNDETVRAAVLPTAICAFA